ncbi:hypothetical protein QVD99_006211 [Batrachochytrium dendrobatidis]|nr:hypothetical protein QVD99_006211 [Batrachochytrium dendrobatidis]
MNTRANVRSCNKTYRRGVGIAVLVTIAIAAMFLVRTVLMLQNSPFTGTMMQQKIADPSKPNDPSLEGLLKRQSTTLEDAVQKYQLKLGRSPPKGYADWFTSAIEKKCLIDDYDIIWEDLAPYHQLGGNEFRRRLDILKDGTHRVFNVHIKDGTADAGGKWNPIFKNSIKTVRDMDLVLNELDEPRILFNSNRDGPRMVTALADPNKLSSESPNWFRANGGEHLQLMKDSCHVYSPTKPLQQPHEFHGYLQWPMSNIYTRMLLPILSQSRISNCFKDILIPSIYYYHLYAGGSSQADSYPWQNRLPKAYWRGSTTGGWNQNGNWKTFHRMRMIDAIQKKPELYDVALTDAIQCEPDDCNEMTKQFHMVSHEPFETVYKYKYALDVVSGSNIQLLNNTMLMLFQCFMTLMNRTETHLVVDFSGYSNLRL